MLAMARAAGLTTTAFRPGELLAVELKFKFLAPEFSEQSMQELTTAERVASK